MKKIIFTAVALCSFFFAEAQFVATMEIKEPIEGLCKPEQVYAILPMLKKQEAAVCPVSEKKILKRLNNEVEFLKSNPDYNDKGMIGLVINCKGEVVKCKMDNLTQSPELDKQIEAVFNSLGKWKPGKINKKKVNTSELFSFEIKNGKIIFD